ncbi:hypothetical protein EV424DRAFT_1343935 [Suillus variegatus]|nr:hypothetical protein EV424DRAFT_1343935 [Suillus variegatus]
MKGGLGDWGSHLVSGMIKGPQSMETSSCVPIILAFNFGSNLTRTSISNILEDMAKTCIMTYAVHAHKDVVCKAVKEIAHRLEADVPVYASHSNPRCTLSPPLCASMMAQPHHPHLDRVCAAEVEHVDSFHQQHVTELFLMQFSSNACLAPSNFCGIVLLTTAESQTSAHSLLHTPHVFKDATSIPLPGREVQKEVGSSFIIGTF